MALNKETIEQLAIHLESAEMNRQEVTKITVEHPEMDWDDAYAIQNVVRAIKEKRGVKIAGLKMGLTSFAKMEQMGVKDPVMGFITDYGQVEDGGTCSTDSLIHPKVEAEIAFVTKSVLRGPDCTVEDVLAATDYVLPAIEVIDSRYRNFEFDLKSVIADNTSSARFVIGKTPCKVDGLDLVKQPVVMSKNGEVVATATGEAVLGNPVQSVAMLANMLARSGQEIPAGTLILTGGATAAVAVDKGDHVVVECEGIGSVSMRFA